MTLKSSTCFLLCLLFPFLHHVHCCGRLGKSGPACCGTQFNHNPQPQPAPQVPHPGPFPGPQPIPYKPDPFANEGPFGNLVPIGGDTHVGPPVLLPDGGSNLPDYPDLIETRPPKFPPSFRTKSPPIFEKTSGPPNTKPRITDSLYTDDYFEGSAGITFSPPFRFPDGENTDEVSPLPDYVLETKKPPKFGDVHPSCCYWASKHECDTNPMWMRPNCQESCGTWGCATHSSGSCRVNIPSQCMPPSNGPIEPYGYGNQISGYSSNSYGYNAMPYFSKYGKLNGNGKNSGYVGSYKVESSGYQSADLGDDSADGSASNKLLEIVGGGTIPTQGFAENFSMTRKPDDTWKLKTVKQADGWGRDPFGFDPWQSVRESPLGEPPLFGFKTTPDGGQNGVTNGIERDPDISLVGHQEEVEGTTEIPSVEIIIFKVVKDIQNHRTTRTVIPNMPSEYKAVKARGQSGPLGKDTFIWESEELI